MKTTHKIAAAITTAVVIMLIAYFTIHDGGGSAPAPKHVQEESGQQNQPNEESAVVKSIQAVVGEMPKNTQQTTQLTSTPVPSTPSSPPEPTTLPVSAIDQSHLPSSVTEQEKISSSPTTLSASPALSSATSPPSAPTNQPTNLSTGSPESTATSLSVDSSSNSPLSTDPSTALSVDASSTSTVPTDPSTSPATNPPTSSSAETSASPPANPVILPAMIEEKAKQTLSELLEKAVSEKPLDSVSASTAKESMQTQVNNVLVRSDELSRPNDEELEAWANFMATYKKGYISPQEAAYRQNVFIANYRFIKAFNGREDALFKLGVNHFADLDQEEINRLFVGDRSSWRRTISQAQVPPPHPMTILSDDEDMTPQLIDWRNVTTDPIDQGGCKESVVFAAIAAVESAFNNQLMKEQPNAMPVKLSERQLIDCLSMIYNAPGAPPVCNGYLSMENVFNAIQSLPDGLATEQNYNEYIRQQRPDGPLQVCHMPPGDLKRAKVSSFSMINQKDMVEALLSFGPLVVAIDASQSTFHFYKSGLFHELNCSPDNYNLHLLLAGYSAGDDPSNRDRPFFLARNSFGLDWGESGYIRLLKDERRNKCLPYNYGMTPTISSQ